jgi:NADPH-dependent 2,4-dienoyl-CoA reductase/sulfur reductase-like enzyme/NAD-dependent dihydropyrimidine dehydrogenase PreA subunit/bacterioferritin-associated ferredoxin
MTEDRIHTHPILPVEPRETLPFTWQDQSLQARAGETIASALYAHGIRVFGHHPKDGSPQGLFCANGQCAQCLVMADGRPVKACMTPVTPHMRVRPVDGLPVLPARAEPPALREIETVETGVLILGGGPSGMAAAVELGAQGVAVLLVDDKARLGGKLVLQTHRFFGSAEAVYAGTRGIDIAEILAEDVRACGTVRTWRHSTALAVFSDRKVGILRRDPETGAERYVLVAPEVLIVATGARERSLAFAGNTLPGVYGAGAFQTLVNRDLVRAADRLLIVGGGNVGLIAGYHALQAGIDVVGLVEALPACGGYKVHADKLRRLGVPIHTSHTILQAEGEGRVASATIAQVDAAFDPVPGTARTLACDTVLIAVGLTPVDAFTAKARAFGMTVFDAGDAQAIAEASAAIFTGRIAGRRAAQALGHAAPIPDAWPRTAAVLTSHPGAVTARPVPARREGVFPVLHCHQEIPCDPCAHVCPQGLIQIPGGDIRRLPTFTGVPGGDDCIGCGRCVTACPGLAITLVDYRTSPARPTVSIPYEFPPAGVAVGAPVTVVDTEGAPLGRVPVVAVRPAARKGGTTVVRVAASPGIAARIAGIRIRDPEMDGPEPLGDDAELLRDEAELLKNEAFVCRCERVTAGEIRALIRDGCRDLNALKAATRVGMGPCGGKTCTPLVMRLFREAGISPDAVTAGTQRPLFVEVALGAFAGAEEDGA